MMAPAGGRYSRVYWQIVDDEKFATIYGNDCALATWLRLLIVADMAYPATASVPMGTSQRGMDALAAAGIIELVGRSRYRVTGLAAEREQRSGSARAAAEARWRTADAPAMRPHSGTDAPAPEPALLAEQSRAEHRKAEQVAPHADADDDHLDAYYRLTGSWPSRKVTPWLNEMADAHGAAAVSAALAAEITSDEDRRTLLSRTEARLQRLQHEQNRAAERRAAERAAQERRQIEQMPEEQRQANVLRLRQMMASAGLADEPDPAA